MALTLSEAAKVSQNDVTRGVIEVVADSPILDRLPFVETYGPAHVINQENSIGTASFRALNGSYTENTGSFTQKTFTLAYLGTDSDLDKAVVRDLSNLNDQRALQLAMAAKRVRNSFSDALINGDGNSNTFVGIDAQAVAYGNVQGATGNGIKVYGSAGADRQAFFMALQDLLSAVDGSANALLVNTATLSKIKAAARLDTAYTETVDAFGRTVATFDGVPFIDMGNSIIAQDETQGTSSDCSSIYAVRFEAGDGVYGITNGGIETTDIGELETKPSYRYRIDWHCGVVVAHPKAVAILRGVRAQ